MLVFLKTKKVGIIIFSSIIIAVIALGIFWFVLQQKSILIKKTDQPRVYLNTEGNEDLMQEIMFNSPPQKSTQENEKIMDVMVKNSPPTGSQSENERIMEELMNNR